MKIRINHDNNDLWCLYSKEQIEIDEKYIEVVEDCLGDEIIKEYKYWYLDALIDEHLEETGEDIEIEEE